MHTAKQLASKTTLLDGRSAAGQLDVGAYLALIERLVAAEDSTIALDKGSLKQAFESFRDRWWSNLPPETDLAAINAAYAWDGYLPVLYECFLNWTFRSSALTMQFFRKFQLDAETAVVLADGFGAASAMFATAWPNCKVYANVMGSRQLKVARQLFAELNLPNLELVEQPVPAEVVLSFETFEHFTEPETYAEPLLRDAQVISYTAPFAVQAHGHWPNYHGVPAADYGKRFSKFLRSRGFVDSKKAVNFAFFNGYPRLFLRQNATA